MKIIPTIIAKNQSEIDTLLKKYKDFKYIQMDIMDGKFVENKSNWFKLKLPKNKKFEAHLMINNPEQWIEKNYKQFEVLIPNFERIKNPDKLIKFVKNKDRKIGFAINPETKINKIKPYLKDLDRILILTVHPGRYGAKFLYSEIKKIKKLRKIYSKEIEVDGHINSETIKKCKKAGANLFSVGSSLKESKNLKEAIKELK